jgi:hypothetical protein
MAGQIIADLKNTYGHPLYVAPDKATWSCPGPGSLRGLGWINHGSNDPIPRGHYHGMMELIRHEMYDNMGLEIPMDNQDLQNCLCEFDKYMRVKTGVGASKRRYNGAN